MISSLLAALGSGLLLSFAFPKVHLDILAWFALIPLLWAMTKDSRPLRTALCGFVFGIAFFSMDVSWTYRSLTLHGNLPFYAAVPIFVGLIALLSIFPTLFGLLFGLLSRGIERALLLAPFAWVTSEFARTSLLTGFPWDLAGYSQSGRIALIQISDLTGVYGVSFVVVLVNAAILELIRRVTGRTRFPWKTVTLAALTLLATMGYGYLRLNDYPVYKPQGDCCRVGILQANIPQEIKWEPSARDYTFKVYRSLAKEAAAQGAGLLIWPETAVPVLFGGTNDYWKRALEISGEVGVPMLVGAPSGEVVEKRVSYYNSAFLIQAPWIIARYDKNHLVPFGEYMPLNWLIPLGPGIAARDADYSPGKGMKVMSVKGCPTFGVLICYEVIFPYLSHRALRHGASILVNITNDGWFGATAAPFQHVAMARLRAVENRTWLIRSANTGISAGIDPAGRFTERMGLNKRGVLVISLPRDVKAGSVYSRFGDIFAWCCVAITLLGCLYSFGSSRRVS